MNETLLTLIIGFCLVFCLVCVVQLVMALQMQSMGAMMTYALLALGSSQLALFLLNKRKDM